MQRFHYDQSRSPTGTSGQAVDGEGHIAIRDGSLETVVTDSDGNTTRVKIDTADSEEFLDYLLPQGKVTVAQHDAYGNSGELELSLKDADYYFEWAVTDKDLYVGIDRDDVEHIRNEILLLLSFDD